MRLKKRGGAKSSTGGSAALFPLPDGFFPKVALKRDQIHMYEHQMQLIVRDALIAYERHEAMGERPVYAEPWRWLSSSENLVAVQHAQSSRSSKPTKTRIFGRVNGDFRHQMDFFYAETGKELFDWNNAMFGNTVDAAVLSNIHTATSRGPCLYMGIKWVCVNAPRILKRKRDQCFLEYMVYTTDLRGRDVGIRVDLPIEIPECPVMAQQLNVKRVKTHSVMILREATNDKSSTDVFFMTETDPGSSYSTAAYYRRLMSVLKDLSLCVDTRRISQQAIRDKDEWVPRAERDACATCKRLFSATRRHHHCRLCGEVICGSCALVRMARRRGDKALQKTKVCLQCVTAIREPESSASVDFSATAAKQGFFKLSELQSGSKSRNDSSMCDSDMETDDLLTSDWESESEFGDRSSSVRSASFDGDFDPELRLSGSSTVAMSESSSRGEKLSFMTKLDVIEDHHDEYELVDFSLDLACLNESDDVTEVLDTKHMAKASALLSALPEQHLLPQVTRFPHASPVASAMGSSCASSRTSSRASSRSGSACSDSLRSIDRCLAEQEELLKRMVLVASKSRTPSTASMS